MELTTKRPFDFPPEILRDVFELAAEDHRVTALSLQLVSSWVRQWTDPIIYHTVVLETNKALSSFLSAISRKSTDFIEMRVKHLGIFAMGPIHHIDKVISACSGVKSLACGFPLPGYARIGGAKTVKSIEPREQHLLGVSCRDGWDPSLIGASVTHLRIHITGNTMDPEHFSRLRKLKSLSHLAIVYRRGTSDAAVVVADMRSLVDTLGLELVLIQIAGSGNTAHENEVKELNWLAESPKGDIRLVAEKAPISTVREWEWASRSGSGIWDRAGKEVHRRRQRLSVKA
ncbi:hypothetical protein NEOLEDRAFT_1057366 [Neolentinus lepideus HHB14362 ss-1]|uniref:F-box domain-containing protein n=1 Tax=Neolentinus lepideus HHB14362 ss-1 TaxID=1314782 RepID=A0A165V0E5_9AGAM|nr:hypothetical protein NEOLEDRAFT_1057366 [Neolentinus lepideus HHB14362 ss-1]